MEEETMIRLVEKITTTGSHQLDQVMMKNLKTACKRDARLINSLFQTLLKQLKRKHSEIRLSAFQVCQEIFQKSHQFRTLILDELEVIFALTLETNNVLLPPPKAAAKKLRILAAETFHDWVTKFGSAYKKLEHGYNYLKQVQSVSFNDIEGRSALERRQELEQRLKMDAIWKERVKKVQMQMDDHRRDMDECLTQINSCLELLVTKPENFLFAEDEDVIQHDDSREEEEEDDHDLKSHGIFGVKTTITIQAKENEDLKETQDNQPVLSNLREQYAIFSHKLLPMVKKWSITLTKAGSQNCDASLLRKSIDIKTEYDALQAKLQPFQKLLKRQKRKSTDNSDDNSEEDSDFIEVEPKPGFEASASVQAEHHLLGIDFYNQPSTSQHIGEHKLHSKAKKKAALDIEELSSRAQKKAKIKVTCQSDHFWSTGNTEAEVEVTDPSLNIFEIEEEFEEVKWSCRAPLAKTGRLCPRKDRFKCPLHGKIIARDINGNPANADDRQAADTKSQEKANDWQDPDLLRDIEAATGINLKVSKGKGKGKKSKSSQGLTCLKTAQNTTRNRLEKKIFNRSAMKRVASDLNKSEYSKRK